MDFITVLLFGLVFFICYVIEAATGFGASILALPFLSMLVDVKTVVPVLPMVNYCLSIFVLLTRFKKIVWSEYIKMLVLLGIGMPFGIWLVGVLDENILKFCLGIFMIVVSVWGLFQIYAKSRHRRTEKMGRVKTVLLSIMMMIGGVVHGAFTTSGPFVVAYATQKIPDKESFRATLCMLWFTLNSIVVSTNFTAGRMTAEVWQYTLISVPFIIAGIYLGNRAHKKMQPGTFFKVIYLVMLLTGLFMAVQQGFFLFR